MMADSVLLVTHSSSLPIPSGTAPWHRWRGSIFLLTRGITPVYISTTAPAVEVRGHVGQLVGSSDHAGCRVDKMHRINRLVSKLMYKAAIVNVSNYQIKMVESFKQLFIQLCPQLLKHLFSVWFDLFIKKRTNHVTAKASTTKIKPSRVLLHLPHCTFATFC